MNIFMKYNKILFISRSNQIQMRRHIKLIWGSVQIEIGAKLAYDLVARKCIKLAMKSTVK